MSRGPRSARNSSTGTVRRNGLERVRRPGLAKAIPNNPFRYFNTSTEYIRLAGMMYVRFPLSLRNVEDLPHKRGIDVCHESVLLWWNRSGPMSVAEIRQKRSQSIHQRNIERRTIFNAPGTPPCSNGAGPETGPHQYDDLPSPVRPRAVGSLRPNVARRTSPPRCDQ